MRSSNLIMIPQDRAEIQCNRLGVGGVGVDDNDDNDDDMIATVISSRWNDDDVFLRSCELDALWREIRKQGRGSRGGPETKPHEIDHEEERVVWSDG